MECTYIVCSRLKLCLDAQPHQSIYLLVSGKCQNWIIKRVCDVPAHTEVDSFQFLLTGGAISSSPRLHSRVRFRKLYLFPREKL